MFVIKKIGFTVAEVLVTLAIIGVISAMIVPSMLNKYNAMQYRTKFKKAYTTLTNSNDQASLTQSFGYNRIDWTAVGENEPYSLNKYVMNLMKNSVLKRASDLYKCDTTNGNCATIGGYGFNPVATFGAAGDVFDFTAVAGTKAMDGTIYLFYKNKILIDVNGSALPNKVVTCANNTGATLVENASDLRVCDNFDDSAAYDMFWIYVDERGVFQPATDAAYTVWMK